MHAGKRIEAATDVAMIGVWDAALDETPLPKRPGLRALEDAATRGDLWLVSTGSDGSYDCEVYVDVEPPPAELEHRVALEGWRLLRAPSGRLCLSGVEDFRARKQKITSPDAYFDVPPGEYRVLAHALDLDTPERQLAAQVGEDDYAYYKPRDDTEMRIFGALIVVILASVAIAIWGDLLIGVAVAATGITGHWLFGRRLSRDARYRRIQDRVSEILGDRTLDDLGEEFMDGRSLLVLELRRLDDSESTPPGGSVTLKFTRDAS